MTRYDPIPKLQLSWQAKILVLHIGGNDLGQVQRYKLLQRMKKDITWIKDTCPNTKMLYSSILPRIKWRNAKEAKSIDNARKWQTAE